MKRSITVNIEWDAKDFPNIVVDQEKFSGTPFLRPSEGKVLFLDDLLTYLLYCEDRDISQICRRFRMTQEQAEEVINFLCHCIEEMS